ncbi:MAG TPA: type II secretion system major pseudopilin GspG [Methylomirabilota bacterium]|jgi:general secretion pathway protein G|nr:type II secretion system major pseudopilin GspG [Methylomirabilota bacterium]
MRMIQGVGNWSFPFFCSLFFSHLSLQHQDAACRASPPSRQYGFTLIEIMVVVFILGLLVTLVAPKIIGRSDEARRTKAAADLRAIEQALHLYKLDNSTYPTTDQGLHALVAKPASGIIPAHWNPDGYLEKVPLDPWGHPYVYMSNGEKYTLKSLGADGEEGGEGKYADIDSRDL